MRRKWKIKFESPSEACHFADMAGVHSSEIYGCEVKYESRNFPTVEDLAGCLRADGFKSAVVTPA